MEVLAEYGLFLAKLITFAVAALVVIAMAMSAAHRARQEEDEGEIQVVRVNDRVRETRETLEASIQDEGARKHWLKDLRRKRKKEKKEAGSKAAKGSEEARRKRLYVVDFQGDIKASQTGSLRRCVSAILSVADPQRDEVVVRLESGGGMVHSYGYAAAQLDRIRQRSLPLTASIDKVAASGGYMMACVADRIVASPFAILGSIGVVAQLPNFHRLLKRNDVDFEVLTAGEYKRTLTVFGENTDKGRKKFRDDLEETHKLFKQYVSEHRPAVDIDRVATGEYWFGRQALEVNLADELKTSDELLMDACNDRDVFLVRYEKRKTLPEKLGLTAATVAESVFMKGFEWLRHSRYQ
ncbi:inner membrane peptidase [Halospina denitrificans]|uniref:Inner membrane peptidase n=1 Tax=Halospina denitrificans TaxID=332522 RepID=A0A4R7JUI9_9GAMM|nr:protease SohB [Halospina denitrificans]TDT41516.1 inner membrane peptidase [Halospina denitrificans]